MAYELPHYYDNLNNFKSACEEYVKSIENYVGADPLAPWYEYLVWMEDHFSIDYSRKTLFEEILGLCLIRFEHDGRYKQDRRLIKLFIKFIQFQDEPDMHYGAMLSNGYGTKVADLYICWALKFESNGDLQAADRILRRGISAQAEPFDLLQNTHQTFNVSQRMPHNRTTTQQEMYNRLENVTSLRIEGRRTETPKSSILQMHDRNALILHCLPRSGMTAQVSETAHNTSIAHNIMDSARKMRRAKSPARRTNVKTCRLNFNENTSNAGIENLYEKGIQLGPDFKSKCIPQSLPPPIPFSDPYIGTYRKEMPGYDKLMLVPSNNAAFSPDELRAYNWFKQRGIKNAFTKEQDKIWGTGFDVPIRWSLVFARKNFPQSEWVVPSISPDDYFNEIGPHKFMCTMNELYPKGSTEEYQLEEVMWQKLRSGPKKAIAQHRSNSPSPKVHRKTSTDNILSPIVEMELSGVTDALVNVHLETIHVNTAVAGPSKKRKSSIFATFDALNDTCTTQQFGNLMRSAINSTPKVAKMTKYGEPSVRNENSQDETHFSDQTTLKINNESNEQNVLAKDQIVSPPEDVGFFIYEDRTMIMDAAKNVAGKNSIGESTEANKENVSRIETQMANLDMIEDALSDKNKTEANIANAKYQAEEKPCTFEIYADPTENIRKTMEMVKSLIKCTSILKNNNTVCPVTQNADEKENIALSTTTADKPITEMTNDELNKHNSKLLKETMELYESFKLRVAQEQMVNGNEPERECEVVTKGHHILEEVSTANKMLNEPNEGPAVHSSSNPVNESNVFKEQSIPNMSVRKTDHKISNQTFMMDLLDSTEEFELLEAQCANSPNGEPKQTPKKLELSAIRNATLNAESLSKSGNSVNNLQFSVFITEEERKNIINNTKICDKTHLNLTCRPSLYYCNESAIGHDENCDGEKDAEEDIGKSIYVPQADLVFDEKEADWGEVTLFLSNSAANNEYVIEDVNLDETRYRIETHMLNLKDLNPFDPEVQKDVLNDLGFLDLLNGANNFNCVMMNIVQPLKPKSSFLFKKQKYQIRKLIGSGAYGKVFVAECTKTKQMLAFKQQRPPNLWEYYVCLQIHERLTNEHVRNGFMAVDFAVIGNNSTIYASKFSKHGTLLDVCNKVKQETNKNIEECVVLIIVKQMLTIMEHFHKANLIHADVKPDNFLLMDKLSLDYKNPDIVLQLIDFGQSIDLNYFSNHVFWAKIKTENFICTEMMEDKPWTFHCDLFCLASTIYTLVAGKYMVVSRSKNSDSYKPQKLPRYVNGTLWNEIFDTLINVPSLKKMPSLSRLQKLLDDELDTIGPKKVTQAIQKFNKALEK